MFWVSELFVAIFLMQVRVYIYMFFVCFLLRTRRHPIDSVTTLSPWLGSITTSIAPIGPMIVERNGKAKMLHTWNFKYNLKVWCVALCICFSLCVFIWASLMYIGISLCFVFYVCVCLIVWWYSKSSSWCWNMFVVFHVHILDLQKDQLKERTFLVWSFNCSQYV